MLALSSARQGLVTGNAVFDNEAILQRTRVTMQPHFKKHWTPIYRPAQSNEDHDIQPGDALFRRAKAPMTVLSQYPRVFSSLAGYVVNTSNLHQVDAHDSQAGTNAAVKVMRNELRFVGLAAKFSPYSPTSTANVSPDAPTVQYAGIADIWNLGRTTIEPGDLVAWNFPSSDMRTDNVQGMSRTRTTAIFEKFTMGDIFPSARQLAESEAPLFKALAEFRGKSTPSTQQETATALDELEAVLGAMREHVEAALSRVVGVAHTKIEPNRQGTIHVKQIAF